MKIRKAAESLLQSQSSSLPVFLAPSIARWHSQSYICRQTISRTFTSSPRSDVIRPTITSEPAPKVEPDVEKAPKPEENLGASLDWLTKGSLGGNRTSRFASPTAQAENRASSPYADRNKLDAEKSLNKGSSAHDLLSAINLMRGYNKPGTLDASKMRLPGGNSNQDSLLSEVASNNIYRPPKIALRLTPSTGRQVNIGAGIDVARGFKMLEMSCARNKIKADSRNQMYHERGGLKRKRLRRTRWRRNFMEGFRATIDRVQDLRRQGW